MKQHDMVHQMGNVGKIGSLCFYAIYWRETKLQVYQWQTAALTAQNFDLHQA